MSNVPTPENILWDLIESEADEKYFLDSYETNAELPGILIVSPHSFASQNGKWTVFFGRGIEISTFNSHKAARAKVMEIIHSAKFKVYPRMVTRDGKVRRLNKSYPIKPIKPQKNSMQSLTK